MRILPNLFRIVHYLCKFKKFLPFTKSFSQVSSETVDHDVTHLKHAEKITSLRRVATEPFYSNFRKSATGERQSLMLSRSKKVASKSDVSRKDTKVTSEAICRALQGLGCREAGEFTIAREETIWTVCWQKHCNF